MTTHLTLQQVLMIKYPRKTSPEQKKQTNSENERKKIEEEKYQKLYLKIDEFLSIQENDKCLVMNLDSSLKKAENEIQFLKEQLQKKEENNAKQKEEDNLKKLTNIVKKQNEKIDDQNKEMMKLKNMIEMNKLKRENKCFNDIK
eukprot:GFUD01057146.1.p1 GENE.GFUD01057146.1~~GFUD01057146.1.p1  ORF type:complete len:144 (-),score=58.29 GFUD01057146.1:132-563(-)